MYRVRSGGWVWYFLEVADWNRLGPRPDNHTGNTETVKINRVRGVFRRDGYYLKTEMPRCTGSFSQSNLFSIRPCRTAFHCNERIGGIAAVGCILMSDNDSIIDLFRL